MKKLCISVAMFLGVSMWAMAQQPTTANPGGADASPAQGEVQQTPGKETPQTVHRPIADEPMIGMNALNDSVIRINVEVTDKQGNPVAGLKEQEFSVMDNGQPRPIKSFYAYTGAVHPNGPPAETVILFDTLNMDPLRVAQSRVAIDQFLHENGGKLAGPTSVFVFAEDGIQGQTKPTTDGNALADNVDKLSTRLRTMGRAAGGWGEVERYNLSLKALGVVAENEAKREGRKLLIWVGPGWPLEDGPNRLLSPKDKESIFTAIMNISRILRQAQITLYSVSLGEPDLYTTLYRGFLKPVMSGKQAMPSDLNTKVIAVQSGGLVLGPDNDMARQIGLCARDAEAYYTITFDPLRADKRDEYHTIQVQTDKPYLNVRTTMGYYSEPASGTE